jgi:hypothetical protein
MKNLSFNDKATLAVAITVLLLIVIGCTQTRYTIFYNAYTTDKYGKSVSTKQHTVAYGWSQPNALDEAWESALDCLPYSVDSIEIVNILPSKQLTK